MPILTVINEVETVVTFNRRQRIITRVTSHDRTEWLGPLNFILDRGSYLTVADNRLHDGRLHNDRLQGGYSYVD